MAEYFTPAELVTRWNGAVTLGTLANWRAGTKKRGPAFTKVGGRVRYPVQAVLDYEAKNTHTAHNDNNQQAAKAA